MNYYVDFENVGCAGLAGIEKLTSSDTVRIYYSKNPGVDMDTVVSIRNSKADIVCSKLHDSIKQMNIINALDIILSHDIAQKVGTPGARDFCVISNDKDYDKIISELKKSSPGCNIARLPNIGSRQKKVAVKAVVKPVSKIDEAALNSLFKNDLKKFVNKKSNIVNIVRTSRSRCDVNSRINHSFNNDDSRKIMAALKPIIKALPGQ